jgi:hypothetical protein
MIASSIIFDTGNVSRVEHLPLEYFNDKIAGIFSEFDSVFLADGRAQEAYKSAITRAYYLLQNLVKPYSGCAKSNACDILKAKINGLFEDADQLSHQKSFDRKDDKALLEHMLWKARIIARVTGDQIEHRLISIRSSAYGRSSRLEPFPYIE